MIRKIRFLFRNKNPLSGLAGPSALARFHEAYNPVADDVGENYFIQSQTQRYTTKGYTYDESLLRATGDARRLRPVRDALNRDTYYNREVPRLDNEIEYEIQLDERDGQYHLYHRDFEEFLPDMIHNWERFLTENGTPELFNKEEAEAILEMDRLMAGGNTKSAIYAVSEPSVADTVRYVNQFVYEDGKVKAQYLDVGKYVRDLDIAEAFDVVKNLGEKFGFRISGEHSYTYLISSHKALNAKQIHDAVFEKLIESDGIGNVRKSINSWEARQKDHDTGLQQASVTFAQSLLGETAGRVTTNVARNVQETIVPIGTLLAAEFFHRNRKQDVEGNKQDKEESGQGKKPTVIDKVKSFISTQFSPKEKKFLTTPESKQGSSRVVTVFERGLRGKKSEDRNAKPQLSEKTAEFAAGLLPVAGEAGIAVVVIKMLTADIVLDRKPKNERKILKKINRRKAFLPDFIMLPEKQKKIRKKKKINTAEFIVQPLKLKERRLKLSRRKEMKRRMRFVRIEAGDMTKPKRKEILLFELLLFHMTSASRQERHTGKTKKSVLGRSHKPSEYNKPHSPERRKQKKYHEKKQTMKEQARWFTVGFLMWILMHNRHKDWKKSVMKPGHIQKVQVKNSETLPYGGESKSQEVKKDAELSGNTETPWLLLAIIWYLAMLREQGMGRSTVSNQTPNAMTKRKRKKSKSKSRNTQSTFPVFGVIYSSYP